MVATHFINPPEASPVLYALSNGLIYFAGIFIAGWLFIKNKNENAKTVRTIAIGLQIFSLFGALNYEVNSKPWLIKLAVPLLSIGLIIVGFKVMYDEAKRRGLNSTNYVS